MDQFSIILIDVVVLTFASFVHNATLSRAVLAIK